MVSDKEIVGRLREILEVADLEVVTEKAIRTQIEREFEIDLSGRKKFIRQEVNRYLSENQPEEEEADSTHGSQDHHEDAKSSKGKEKKRKASPAEDEEKPKRRGGGGLLRVCTLSDTLANFLGAKEMPRTEVVKAMWAYIREKGLQDPANKRNILCDESLEKVFGKKKTNMFEMNKLLTVHIHSNPSEGGAKGEAKATAKKPKSDSADDSSAGKKRSGGGFAAPLPLSPALKEFFGGKEDALARSEVVKRMWDYIKEHNLQDPQSRKNILCDEALKKLLGVDTFAGFGMAKYLSPHFLKKSANGSAEAEGVIISQSETAQSGKLDGSVEKESAGSEDKVVGCEEDGEQEGFEESG